MIFININYRKLAINLWGINDNLRLMNIYLFLSKKKSFTTLRVNQYRNRTIIQQFHFHVSAKLPRANLFAQ